MVNGGDKYKLHELCIPDDSPTEYCKTQVIAEVGNGYTIFCENREFSTPADADHLFERIGEYTTPLSRIGTLCRVYITDIDRSNGLTSDPILTQSVRHLLYK